MAVGVEPIAAFAPSGAPTYAPARRNRCRSGGSREATEPAMAVGGEPIAAFAPSGAPT